MRLEPISVAVSNLSHPYGRGWSAIFQVNRQLAYVAACLVAVWLGCAMGRTHRGVRLSILLLLTLLVLYQDRLADTLTRMWWPSIFLATWVPTLACALFYLTISSRADSATSSTALVPTVK